MPPIDIMCTVSPHPAPPARYQNDNEKENLAPVEYLSPPSFKGVLSSDDESCSSSTSSGIGTLSTASSLSYAADDQANFEMDKTYQTECKDHIKSIVEKKLIHRVVFTGGPCAGKTTSINRMKNFFENIGWKVFCVPETATLLLSTGILFYELENHTIAFQENLLKTLLQIEDTINQTVKFYNTQHNKNCLVLYDRGAMDPVAYLKPEDWETLKMRNPSWNEIDLRDNRYDQIVHLVTAAEGAEDFYTLDNNATRTEGLAVAKDIDKRCTKAWMGHPYIDVIDNRTNFDQKVARVLKSVCHRIGLDYQGAGSSRTVKKRKFLVKSMPNDELFEANFQDFNVIHNYLVSNSPNVQARIRKRGQADVWSYTYTVRVKKDNQNVETKSQIDSREYAILLKTVDANHLTIYKRRRCFQWNHRYYQMDTYEAPCNASCDGLIILSTYVNNEELDLSADGDQRSYLPDFLDIEREITDDPQYSMHTLSKKQQA